MSKIVHTNYNYNKNKLKIKFYVDYIVFTRQHHGVKSKSVSSHILIFTFKGDVICVEITGNLSFSQIYTWVHCSSPIKMLHY